MANAGDATLATVGINVGPDDPDLEERLNAYGTIGYRALHIGISAFLIDDTSFRPLWPPSLPAPGWPLTLHIAPVCTPP